MCIRDRPFPSTEQGAFGLATVSGISDNALESELCGWIDAIKSYPGVIREEIAVPWVEAIVSDLSPLLMQVSSNLPENNLPTAGNAW